MNDRIHFKIPLYAFTQAILLGLPVLVTPILLRVLSPFQYGVYEAACVWIVFINGVVSLEIAQGFQRLYPESEITTRRSLLGTALVYVVIAYSFVFFLYHALFRHQPFLTDYKKFVPVFILVGLSQGLFSVCSFHLRLSTDAGRFVRIMVLYAVLFLGAHGYLYWYSQNSNISLEQVFLAQASVAFFGVLICIVSAGFREIGMPSFFGLKQMLRYSIPLALSSVPLYFSGILEVGFITKYLGSESLGRYLASARIATAVNLFAAGTYLAMIPQLFAQPLMGNKKDEYSAHSSIRNGMQLFQLFTIPLVFVLTFLASEILGLFFAFSDPNLVSVFLVLLLSTFIGKLSIFFPGIEVKKTTSFILIIQLLVLCVSALGYVVISSDPTLMKFAVLTLLVSVFRISIFAWMSKKSIGMSFSLKDWAPIGVMLLVVGVFIFIQLRLSETVHFGIRVALMSVLVVGFLMYSKRYSRAQLSH